MDKGVTNLWENCECSRGEFEEWHKLECLMGDCTNYGVVKLSIYPNEYSTMLPRLLWRCFKHDTIGVIDEGKPKKSIKKTFWKTTTSMFLDYLRPKLQHFIKHNFGAKWQDNQCKLVMANLPPNCIPSHIDSAENYTFQIQNEIQPMH